MAIEAFVDTSFIVALSLKSDTNHLRALELIKKYPEHSGYINDLIVYESVNVLCRLGGVKKAKVFKQTVDEKDYKQIVITKIIWDKGFNQLSLKYTKSGPNVFDFIHFACMQEYGLKNVFTFDHHFASAGFNILK